MGRIKDKRYLKVRKVLSYLAIRKNKLNEPEFTLEFRPGSNTKRVCPCFVKKLYGSGIPLLKELRNKMFQIYFHIIPILKIKHMLKNKFMNTKFFN